MAKKIRRIVRCGVEYIVDHQGPLRPWESCSNDDCEGTKFRKVTNGRAKP